ncbi:MAG: PIN domain-containing protein [Acidimicrobiia bacterium]|nr:PIN domain-containing protein [Acidimicrobiia bacterium]
MILCDSNIWLAMALSGHVHHPAVRAWLDTIDEPAVIQFCRATQQTFLRLLTNAAVLAPYGNPPLTNDEAWAAYESLLGDDRVSFHRAEPPELESMWRRFAQRDSASPKLWMDAYLAAFALAGGFTLVTTDAAFRQFSDLDLVVLP